MIEWLLGFLSVLAVLACPAMMLVGMAGRRVSWRRLVTRDKRAEVGTRR